MAQITWRNVEAPNFASSSESQRLSQVMLNQGLGAIGTALDKYKEAGIQTAVGAEAQQLAGITTAAQLDAALSSGAISAESMQDPTFRSQVFARKQSLLENEQQRLANVNTGLTGQGIKYDNEGKVIQNASSAETLEQNKFLHENIRKEYAAAPAATSAVNTILGLADGTPQGLKNSYAKLEELMPALQAAGMGAEFVEGLREKIRGTTTSEISQKTGFSEEEKRVLGIQQTKDADALFKQAVATKGSPQATKNYILANSTDPVVIGLAMKMVDDNPALYPTGDMASAAIEQSVNANKNGINYGVVANQIIGVESAGDPNAQNPNSSAGGLGQFIDSTWLQTVKQYRPDIASGKSDAELLALKTDPGLNRQMTVALTQENGTALQNKGIEANPGNLYLAHFLGVDGAAAVLRAAPGTSVESIVGKDKIDANPQLKGMTVEGIRNWATQKMGGTRGPVTGPGSAADQASSQIRAAATAAAPGAGVTRELANEGIRLGSQAQILNNQLTLGQSLDATIPTLQEMTSGTPGHEADIARQMHASVGDEGGLDEATITGQIMKMKEDYGIPPHVAAAMLKNATDQTQWGLQWLQGKIKIDDNTLDSFVRQFINPDAKDQAGKIRPAMELMSQMQSRKYNSDKLAQAQTRVTEAEKEYSSQVLAQQTRPGISTRESAERLIAAQDEFRREITRVNGSPYAGGNLPGIGGTTVAPGTLANATPAVPGTNGATPPAAVAPAVAGTPTPNALNAAADAISNAITGGQGNPNFQTSAEKAAAANKPGPRGVVSDPLGDLNKIVGGAQTGGISRATVNNIPATKSSRSPGSEAADAINQAANGKPKPAEEKTPAQELEESIITPDQQKHMDDILRTQTIIDQADYEAKSALSVKRAKEIAKKLEDEGIPEEDWPASLKKMLKKIKPSDDDE